MYAHGKNDLIARKRKDNPVLPKGKSSDVKPKMIQLDRTIGHKSVMSICEFSIDRDEPAHLVDQVINNMEGIRDASDEGANGTGQLFAVVFFPDRSAALWVLVYLPFLHG